jgi:cysteine desulfurase
MRVYFDNAATTPMRPEVVDAMLPFLRDYYGNPSSIHAEGRKVRAAIEQARKTVANCIGASLGEIFFTSGGTESNNMALKCSVRDLGVERIISSPIEHHCVLHTLECIRRDSATEVVLLEVDSQGRPNLVQLEKLLAGSAKKTLVSLMHANNEIGTMIDIEAVSAICHEHGALFHSDTVQTVGHFPVDVGNTKISFLSGAAHKFHGPKGIGFIYINGDNIINPLIDGGAQERNMRGGTENVCGIVGLAQALKLMVDEMDHEARYVKALRNRMADALRENFPGIRFNGDPFGDALYTVLSVAFPPSDKSEMMLLALDINGVCASGGSACSSGAETQSHVLEGIRTDPERKTIRFSFSCLNTEDEVDYVIEQLKKIVPSTVTA